MRGRLRVHAAPSVHVGHLVARAELLCRSHLGLTTVRSNLVRGVHPSGSGRAPRMRLLGGVGNQYLSVSCVVVALLLSVICCGAHAGGQDDATQLHVEGWRAEWSDHDVDMVLDDGSTIRVRLRERVQRLALPFGRHVSVEKGGRLIPPPHQVRGAELASFASLRTGPGGRLVLAPLPGASLEVLVRTPQGSAAQGVTVVSRCIGRDLPFDAAESAISDAGGIALLSGLVAGQQLVWAKPSSRFTKSGVVRAQAPVRAALEIVVAPATRVGGRVRASNGRAAKAHLLAQFDLGSSSLVDEVTTEASGAFTWPSLPSQSVIPVTVFPDSDHIYILPMQLWLPTGTEDPLDIWIRDTARVDLSRVGWPTVSALRSEISWAWSPGTDDVGFAACGWRHGSIGGMAEVAGLIDGEIAITRWSRNEGSTTYQMDQVVLSGWQHFIEGPSRGAAPNKFRARLPAATEDIIWRLAAAGAPMRGTVSAPAGRPIEVLFDSDRCVCAVGKLAHSDTEFYLSDLRRQIPASTRDLEPVELAPVDAWVRPWPPPRAVEVYVQVESGAYVRHLSLSEGGRLFGTCPTQEAQVRVTWLGHDGEFHTRTQAWTAGRTIDVTVDW